MKKIFICSLALVLTLLIVLPTNAKAETPSQLYDKGVSQNIIDPNLYPKAQWEQDETSKMKPSYEVFKTEVSDTTSYEEWLKLNNYGVMSDTKQPILHGKEETGMLRSEQDNINAFCRDTRAGDILVIDGDTRHGVPSMLGHAAILNADGFVLEMSGGGRDNNHQFTKRDWITRNIKAWTNVYRINNRGLANQVAHYADTHFYSTTGGYNKNIHIDYGINSHLKQFNPNYCSKLVYQAYFYGSGSLPVMIDYGDRHYVAPAVLTQAFSGNYRPYRVGRY